MSRAPIYSTAAIPAAVINATNRPEVPSRKVRCSRARIPAFERSIKRPSSRASWPNAFTTRAAPKTSCTTPNAELSIFLSSRDSRRRRLRYARETRKIAGEIPRPTKARRQLIRAVAQIIAMSVQAEAMNGSKPSTAMFCSEVASY